MDPNHDEIIEIYSGTLWESEMITTLLKDEGIETFLKNCILQAYAYQPIFSEGVKVMIFGSDFERAKEIVENYRKRAIE